MTGPRALTCASRTGRKLWRSKTLAALAAAQLALLLRRAQREDA